MTDSVQQAWQFMRRRDFLKWGSIYWVQGVCGGVLTGCNRHHSLPERPLIAARFPQGVASADPTSNSVVLWTRAEPVEPEQAVVYLELEVATDPAFANLVVQALVEAKIEHDYTVRAGAQALQPDQVYFYRFRSTAGDISRTGRTWTAPSSESNQPVNFAFVSCQERQHGYYGAYRRLLKDDSNQPVEARLRFILHLGDFIYETDESWQAPVDDSNEPLPGGLLESSGAPRNLGVLPDSATSVNGIYHAETVADYRYLYKTYLQDPDLLEARAHWPFVCLWDDHEFSDDCWQSEANYVNAGEHSSTDEPSQTRKVAANQAWFEFIPMDYSAALESDPGLHHARPFEFTSVQNTSNAQPNPDNAAALASLTIYRRLHFGQLFDLILTDNRSYRSDHAVPEDISGNFPEFLHPRAGMPLALLNQMDAGRDANGGQPERFLSMAGKVFLNPRAASPPGTILGETQKHWWKSVMLDTRTRWRIWGNSVPLLRLRVNLSRLDTRLPDVVLSSDAWDGYATERNELMQFLAAQQISGVISLAGDLHAHFAGQVMANYDAAVPEPVIAEVVTAAISSQSMFSALERRSRMEQPSALAADVRRLITYPDVSQPQRPINNIDNTLRYGIANALAAARGELPVENDVSDNPHLLYADTDAHGYGVVQVTEAAVWVALHTLKTITEDAEADKVLATTRFKIVQSANGTTAIEMVQSSNIA